MSDVLKVNITSDADIFIMEYRLKKFMEKYRLELPSVPLVARELATNILKYGEKGFVEFALKRDKVLILADDTCKGSGSNSEKRLKRGLGIGLKIVKKNSDEFEMEEKEDGGTRIRVAILFSQKNKKKFTLQFGTFSRPHYLEKESGDVCLNKKINGKYLLLAADVLGHGSRAREVARLIECYFKDLKEERIEKIYAGLEKLLQGTRGCAVFIAFISEKEIEYINVGDIKGWILFPDFAKKLKETPGVVGRTSVSKKVFKEPVSLLNSTLLVYTDGIKSSFIPRPEMVWVRALNTWDAAEKIVKDFGVKEDDATVVIARGGIEP